MAGEPVIAPALAKPPAKVQKSQKAQKAHKVQKGAKAQKDQIAGKAAKATPSADAGLVQAGVPAQVAAALRRAGVPASATSFYVVKLGAPSARASWNAQQPMNPASTMKLVTTFAGLQLLGPEYRWQTSLYADAQPGFDGTVNGNVYLRGRGDPKLVPSKPGCASA